MKLKELILKKLWNRIEVIWVILIFVILFLASSLKSEADIHQYNLQATLTDLHPVSIDNEVYYYDLFYIHSDGPAQLTFDNYNASLISPYDNEEYSDPYLYLYKEQTFSFNNINSFASTWVLFAEDDDGNEDIGEGLYFFLDNVMMTNHIIAMVTSYDPDTTGIVDFSISSNKELNIHSIPEPAAISLLFTAGFLLILLRRNRGLIQ